MTTPDTGDGERMQVEREESPEKLPPKAWITLVAFAVFATVSLSCMSVFLFG